MQLAEIKARHLPRADWREIFEVTGESITDEEQKALSGYFSQFLAPAEKCVGCERTLGGLLGSFQWGLANGEGFCGRCNYPARAYHRDIGPIELFQLILQYHPDELHEREAVRVDPPEEEAGEGEA